jgi:hypothetical protein
VPNAQVCVYFWRYILQNYNYKLHFQNLSIYHILHVSIGTFVAENFDVCIACDSWNSNIQLTMVKDWKRQIYVGFVANIDIKILGVPPPPQAGHAFPRHRHMRRRRGGERVIYFYQGFLPYMMPSMDGKLHEKRSQRPLLYIMIACKYFGTYKWIYYISLMIVPSSKPI